jgi:hypothetical protein
MVSGLRFTTNPTLYPFTMLTSSPWRKSPNVPPRMKNKASTFVNNFSFSFLEFFAKIYWANFFPWAKEEKIGRCAKNWTGPAPETASLSERISPMMLNAYSRTAASRFLIGEPSTDCF